MKFAYADPPYPGQAKRHYRCDEIDHEALVARLESEYDGWALSTGSKMLQDVLALCPSGVRVLAWVKPMAPPMGDGFMYGWEPVIVAHGRKPDQPMRDWIQVSPDGDTFRPRPKGDVIGAKPKAFSWWLFRAMGLRPDDELDDLFVGSGGVAHAWREFQRQMALHEAVA